jgi:ribosomal protein S17E
MNWLIGKRSQLSLENKVLLYKAILKPVWPYGIELWGCANPCNTKILQIFQSKTLRDITGAPWYVSNKTIHEDLNIPLITDVIKKQTNRYRNRITGHLNKLIEELSHPHVNERRLKRNWPEDLIN